MHNMLTDEDFTRAYEYATMLAPICGAEDLEAELMSIARPREHITPMFLTSRRRQYLKFHLKK